MTPSTRPTFLRASLSRIAVTGAATLVTTFAIGPVALAVDGGSAPQSQPSDVGTVEAQPVESSAAPEVDEADPSAGTVTDTPEDVAPVEDSDPSPQPAEPAPAGPDPEPFATNQLTKSATIFETAEPGSETPLAEDDPAYVDQQISVSVKIADGAYVAEGTGTVGSKFQIDVTLDGETTTTYCDTSEGTGVGTESFCLFGEDEGGRSRLFTVPAGASVQVTQIEAADGLEINYISGMGREPSPESGSHALVFQNYGPSPVTAPDERMIRQGQFVDIDVLDNDQSDDPARRLTISEATPAHGVAEVIEIEGRQQIRYAPNEDFIGNDEFKYMLTDSNGESAGTVHINVIGADDVTPNYGSQKYRVGVQIADGSYVPEGTTTVGSTFTITTRSQDGTETVTHCTTETTNSSGVPGETDTSSMCPGTELGGLPFPYPFYVPYSAPAGATVTITQASAQPGLVPQANPIVIEPCDYDVVEGCPTIDAMFVNRGTILPVAVDDSATGDAGKSVRIDVLANDTSEDPNTTMSIADGPGHGTARVTGSPTAPATPEGQPEEGGQSGEQGASGLLRPSNARTLTPTATSARVVNQGSLAVVYTPARNFSGVDTFTYTLANGNGTSTATVSVRVRDGEVVDSSDSDSSGPDSSDSGSSAAGAPAAGPSDTAGQALPDTGGPTSWLLVLGGLLVAAGSAVASRARRGVRGSKFG